MHCCYHYVLGPKEEKGPSEPDELVVVPHGLHGEPGALLVVGEERRNRGIPRELLGTNQGIYNNYAPL
jgi:hypothetical protein